MIEDESNALMKSNFGVSISLLILANPVVGLRSNVKIKIDDTDKIIETGSDTSNCIIQ